MAAGEGLIPRTQGLLQSHQEALWHLLKAQYPALAGPVAVSASTLARESAKFPSQRQGICLADIGKDGKGRARIELGVMVARSITATRKEIEGLVREEIEAMARGDDETRRVKHKERRAAEERLAELIRQNIELQSDTSPPSRRA